VDGTTVAIAMETVVEIAGATEETAAITVVVVASRQAVRKAVHRAVTADSKRAAAIRKAAGRRKPAVRVRNRSHNLNNSRHVRHTSAARTGASHRRRLPSGTISVRWFVLENRR
jgi:hypothetical protein